MSDQQNRKLAAILFADIQGYTSLMQSNETEGLKIVNHYRQVLQEKVQQHQGEILQHYGDGSLVIFSSGISALQCAKELQEIFKKEPQVPLRIGIHIGDIVIKGNDIFGDGVNLASRVESLGIPGSVLFTQRIIPDLKSHPEFQTTSLGQFHFKNVKEPMEVFALTNEGFPVPKRSEMKGKLKPTSPIFSLKWLALILLAAIVVLAMWLYKPTESNSNSATISDNSVAVLPFTNMNKDEEGELFCDGMMEDILTYLSKLQNLKVISRTSAVHYKNTTKKIPEIANELGVAHIVEGSVRKYEDKARITVQLIRATDDLHLWAESYDRNLQDIFAVQSEVAQQIVKALNINISSSESKSIQTSSSINPEAYQLFIKGKHAADDRNKEGLEQSEQQLQAAIALDSSYADAYAYLAFTRFLRERREFVGWEANLQIEQLAKKALEHDPQNVMALCVLGGVYQVRGELEKTRAAFEKALTLGPNDPTAHHAAGQYYSVVGDYEKELVHRKKVIELDPLLLVYHTNYVDVLNRLNRTAEARTQLKKLSLLFPKQQKKLIPFYGEIALQEGNYKGAIPYFQEAIKDNPSLSTKLGFCLAKAGEKEKARQMIQNDGNTSYQLPAIIYTGLNELDSAFFYLNLNAEKLTQEKGKMPSDNSTRLRLIDQLKNKTIYTDLRKDPRFELLMKKLTNQ